MIRRFFPVLLALATPLASCGSSHTQGEMGRADFSYVGFLAKDDPLDAPFLAGEDVTVRIALHSGARDATIAVSSSDAAVLVVKGFGRGAAPGEWQAVVHGASVGTAKLVVAGSDGKALDQVAMSTADAAKIVAPGALSLSVGETKHVDAEVQDKDGHAVHAGPSLAWTLDSDPAIFWAPLDLKTGPVAASGEALDLRGNRPGATALRGAVGRARADVSVTVK